MIIKDEEHEWAPSCSRGDRNRPSQPGALLPVCRQRRGSRRRAPTVGSGLPIRYGRSCSSPRPMPLSITVRSRRCLSASLITPDLRSLGVLRNVGQQLPATRPRHRPGPCRREMVSSGPSSSTSEQTGYQRRKLMDDFQCDEPRNDRDESSWSAKIVVRIWLDGLIEFLHGTRQALINSFVVHCRGEGLRTGAN